MEPIARGVERERRSKGAPLRAAARAAATAGARSADGRDLAVAEDAPWPESCETGCDEALVPTPTPGAATEGVLPGDPIAEPSGLEGPGCPASPGSKISRTQLAATRARPAAGNRMTPVYPFRGSRRALAAADTSSAAGRVFGACPSTGVM